MEGVLYLNAEIEKYTKKCEKYRQKIMEFQALLEEAERNKMEAENAYIIAKVRSSGYTADELLTAVLSLKSQQIDVSTENAISAQSQSNDNNDFDHGNEAIGDKNSQEDNTIESYTPKN